MNVNEVIAHSLIGATDDELFSELERRGYDSTRLIKHRSIAKRKPERNTEPEEKWMTVWASIERAAAYSSHQNQIDTLIFTLRRLYELLEPPSAREIRLRNSEAEDST
jgi:hypothetical protein